MKLSGAQRYTFEDIREQIDKEISNENMPRKLYTSMNNIMNIINTIVDTGGNDWASKVVDNEGKPLLSEEEQTRFTELFKPYIHTILDFFDKNSDNISGGAYTPSVSGLSGLSDKYLKTKVAQVTHSLPSSNVEIPDIDGLYTKIINRLNTVNSTVNNYASKYGILKLEKEHDLKPDIRLIPEPIAIGLSEGIFGVTSASGVPILPQISLDVMSKLKVPFRTIIFTLYLILDVARISIGLTGSGIGRKILSILVAILELLKGDWKKSILTLIGYYGMMPMLIGELIKVVLSMFRMLSPQIQETVIYGALDGTKSFIIGLLLSLFQVTAPESVRLPLIGALEKVAQHKAKIDGTLEDIGLSARPDYLSPTWNDLNNIQAVMSDEAYICSCEFRDLVKAVNNSAIIQLVLQLLRIPISKEMIEYKCGDKPCDNFATTLIKESKNENNRQPSKIIRGGRILHSQIKRKN